jgi:gas vesicle protein
MTNRFGRKLSLLLAGALAGGVAATLAAPCSGKRLRKLARRRIDDGAKRVEKGMRHRRDELLSRSEKIVHGAQKLFA